MPWSVTDLADSRKAFVAAALQRTVPFRTLCEAHGISAKTGYKILKRVKDGDPQAYQGHSRRPRTSPHAVAAQTADLVLAERLRHPHWGAEKLLTRLSWQHPHLALPSLRTANRILSRAGLAGTKRGRKRHRYPNAGSPFDQVHGPNEVWTTDFKGQFRLRGGQLCYPLTLLDNYSRFLLRCTALTSTAVEPARRAFEHAFREYGVPARIRSDNGVPFASHGICGLSRLSVWWLKMGIGIERIEPGCPQQNGEHERFHKTLKQEATRPPEKSQRAQQKRFDQFAAEYNDERPHAALKQSPPVWHYRPSDRVYRRGEFPGLEYPEADAIRQVRTGGNIKWKGHFVFVSEVLEGEPVALDRVAEDLWGVYFGPLELGLLRDGRSSLLPVAKPTFGRKKRRARS